jgi:transposase, IS5 family
MNTLSKQGTLAMMTGFERYTKKTRRAKFLEEMEQVVPWTKLGALIEPHYPKAGKGRRPKELEKMLRIYFLQQWFNLADPAVEEALYDSVTLRQFVGIDLGAEPVPDETTVCKFRHLLEEHNMGEEILGTVNLHLQAKGCGLRPARSWTRPLFMRPPRPKTGTRAATPRCIRPGRGSSGISG